MAWGQSYIGELFNYALPALLAPGNLPALVAEFDCEVVLVTEEAWFDRLREHPSYRRIAEHCAIELRAVDEFVNRADAYGMALTFALFRGFEELGAAMLDTHLVFFNTDFIMADGSLGSLARKIREGERLVLSPSYCVVIEDVMPHLAARRDAADGVLAMPPREMAALALRHRHNTIRGKTLNQRLFSMEHIDQFYWLVDENTLIGRQLPIAVVCMRPTRILTEMRTFWDYGIIAEACPNVTPCVLGDSDDFLMIELRKAETARDQIALGWPTPAQVAEKMLGFVTHDTIPFARHTLVLHSGELPAGIAAAETALDAYVETVLCKLPDELPGHLDHPNWVYHRGQFENARRDYLIRRGRLTKDRQSGPEGAAPPPWRFVFPSTGTPDASRSARWSAIRLARRFYHRVWGAAPYLEPTHPRWSDVQPVLRALAATLGGRVLIVQSGQLEEAYFRNVFGSHVAVRDIIGTPPRRHRFSGPAQPAHPIAVSIEAASVKPQVLRIDFVQGLAITLVSADCPLPDPVHAYCPDYDAGLAPEVDEYAPPTVTEEFDLCICEIGADDLLHLQLLVSRLAPCVRAGGSILIFHLNPRFGELSETQALILNDALALDLPARFHFAGSELAARAALGLRFALANLGSQRPAAMVRGALQLARSVMRARRAAQAVPADSMRPPEFLTSFVIEVSVVRPAAPAPSSVPAKVRLAAKMNASCP